MPGGGLLDRFLEGWWQAFAVVRKEDQVFDQEDLLSTYDHQDLSGCLVDIFDVSNDDHLV